jgi:hypothetical protein
MKQLSAAAVEPAMKLQDVMLRAMAKRITWYQAAEILGISCRQMQRWKTRFESERSRVGIAPGAPVFSVPHTFAHKWTKAEFLSVQRRGS